MMSGLVAPKLNLGAFIGRACHKLTARQVEVWALMSSGMSNKEVAARLGVIEATIKGHGKVIFRQLGVRNRVEAALIAYREGLVQ